MKRYVLLGIFLLFFGGCTPQPSLETKYEKCSYSSKYVVPYSLEYLEKEYVCKQEELR